MGSSSAGFSSSTVTEVEQLESTVEQMTVHAHSVFHIAAETANKETNQHQPSQTVAYTDRHTHTHTSVRTYGDFNSLILNCAFIFMTSRTAPSFISTLPMSAFCLQCICVSYLIQLLSKQFITPRALLQLGNSSSLVKRIVTTQRKHLLRIHPLTHENIQAQTYAILCLLFQTSIYKMKSFTVQILLLCNQNR